MAAPVLPGKDDPALMAQGQTQGWPGENSVTYAISVIADANRQVPGEGRAYQVGLWGAKEYRRAVPAVPREIALSHDARPAISEGFPIIGEALGLGPQLSSLLLGAGGAVDQNEGSEESVGDRAGKVPAL